jgi:DNA modification methylase
MNKKLEYWNIKKFVEYKGNPRKNDHAVDKMAEAIKTFGFRVPILAKSDGLVVDGHLRLKAARKVGLKELPVINADDMTDVQVKAFRISVNKMADLADWDEEMLGLEFAELQGLNFDLSLTGFDISEVGKFIRNNEPTEGEDDAPEPEENPVSKLGDIWILGDHRVMCGDSTDPETVAKLMNGQKADMVFTDPPYRMQVEGGSDQPIGRAAAKLGEEIKHLCDFDPIAFLDVLLSVFKKNTHNSYVFCNKDLVPDYLNWAILNKLSFNILVWKKPNAIPLGGNHRPDIEYLLLFRKSAHWNNAVPDVDYSKCLSFDRENSTPHPTMKPVGLIENEVKISSDLGHSVLDLFGGSGSTLIACEKTGRHARLMELDPKYVDVIVKRWMQFTGRTAVLEATGEPFPEKELKAIAEA